MWFYPTTAGSTSPLPEAPPSSAGSPPDALLPASQVTAGSAVFSVASTTNSSHSRSQYYSQQSFSERPDIAQPSTLSSSPTSSSPSSTRIKGGADGGGDVLSKLFCAYIQDLYSVSATQRETQGDVVASQRSPSLSTMSPSAPSLSAISRSSSSLNATPPCAGEN